jgi:16S rRNA (uracil1498-N3)-methyltransferase
MNRYNRHTYLSRNGRPAGAASMKTSTTRKQVHLLCCPDGKLSRLVPVSNALACASCSFLIFSNPVSFMSQRFFVESPITGETATLVEAEAHHLLHVMRAKAGAEVTLFDGTGCEFTARVEKLGRQAVELAILERVEVSCELARPVTLAVALPKGDRQKWLVEKATELGVTRLMPLKTERGVAQPVDQAIVRLRRSVIEASKQCGRNVLMEITEPIAWPGLAGREEAANSLRIIAHPGGESLHKLSVSAGIIAAVGPEGGFSPAEVELAQSNNWQCVGLGRSILRVETAALAIAAWAALE